MPKDRDQLTPDEPEDQDHLLPPRTAAREATSDAPPLTRPGRDPGSSSGDPPAHQEVTEEEKDKYQ